MKFLTSNLRHLLADIEFPLVEYFIVHKLVYELENLLFSFFSTSDLVLLEISHFKGVLSKIFWKTSFMTQFCWEIDVVSTPVVHYEKWLFWVELDFVSIMEILSHGYF